MKYLTLAVLFAVMQMPAQAPRKPADNSQQHTEDAQHTVGISKLPPVSVTKDWADWGVWVFSGLLVVVGFLQVWLLWGTLRAIRRQADIMDLQAKKLDESVAVADKAAEAAQTSADAANANIDLLVSKERTRIFVELFPLELKATIHTLGNCVKYTVMFHSPTFAFIEDTTAAAVATNSPETPSQDQFFGSINIPKVIPPGFPDEECYSFIYGANDQFEIDQIEHGESFVHFRGFIKYKDFMGRDRETTFCYRWQPQAANALIPVQWVKTGPPEANQET